MPTDLSLHVDRAIRQELPLDFARAISCLHTSDWHRVAATRDLERRWPLAYTRLKSAVPAGTTTSAGWVGDAISVVAAEFINFVSPFTILGRLPGLRRVPFNTPVIRSSSAIAFGWAGGGRPKAGHEGHAGRDQPATGQHCRPRCRHERIAAGTSAGR